MQMDITKAFLDEASEIRKAINGITSTGCKIKYQNYLDNCGCIGPLEEKFKNLLNSRKENLILRLYRRDYEKLSKEELVEKLLDIERNGTYEVCNRCADNTLIEILEEYSDTEVYPYIVSEMISAIDEIVEESRRTTKDRDRKKFEEFKHSAEREIKRQQDLLLSYNDRLTELNKE